MTIVWTPYKLTWVHCDNCWNLISTEDDENGKGMCRSCMLKEIGDLNNMTDEEVCMIWCSRSEYHKVSIHFDKEARDKDYYESLPTVEDLVYN